MTGYRNPPVEHRFKPGQSGNPKGGPRGPRRKPAQRRSNYLDETISCSIGGKRFKGQRREALVIAAIALSIAKRDLRLQQLLLKLEAQSDEIAAHIERDNPLHMIVDWPSGPSYVGCIEDAADVAGFGAKAYRKQKSARVLLENWVIEEGLARLGDRRLSRDEQMQVLAATRFPKRMSWPDWWDPDLKARGKGWRAPQVSRNMTGPKPPQTVRMSLGEYMIKSEPERLRSEEIHYARHYSNQTAEDQQLLRKPFERPGYKGL